jgi:signal peptidase II
VNEVRGALSADDVRLATERRLRREARERWTRLVTVAVAVLVIDQIIKAVIRGRLAVGEGWTLTGFLSILRVTNHGIAFGMFPGRQSYVAIITVVALCAIAVFLARLVHRNLLAATGAGLLVGGSLGNLIDRLAHGGVTDYINVSHWPTFNFADACITIGAILIVWGLLQGDGDEDDDVVGL